MPHFTDEKIETQKKCVQGPYSLDWKARKWGKS